MDALGNKTTDLNDAQLKLSVDGLIKEDDQLKWWQNSKPGQYTEV
jgi:hypothetical protein